MLFYFGKFAVKLIEIKRKYDDIKASKDVTEVNIIKIIMKKQ